MSVTFPFGQTVTLIRRVKTGTDSDGNDEYGDVPTVIDNVPVWPRNASELLQGQDVAVTGQTCLLPAGTDVSHIDAVEINSIMYEVDGEPGFYLNPFTGTNPGVEVQLTRITG